jgi:S-adenosylmethionine:tRNA ribosyltransferase-isomerase
VVAVGTTVTRALESAAGDDGVVRAAQGWTELVLSEQRPAKW